MAETIDNSSVNSTPTSKIRYGDGATVEPNYLQRSEDIVGVSVSDLKDLQTSAMEETRQFIIAEFFVAGALWLGIERAFTIPIFWEDLLFWICLIVVLAGLIVAYFGFAQLRRRKSKIEKIIPDAEARKKEENKQLWSNISEGTKS